STAHAQATRTWVSGVGDDVNPCSRTAPCKTFAGAISKTAAGGEINCLDTGAFGAVTITKSMTISCQAGTAGILAPGTNGVIVNAAATDYVYLKGLDIEGVGVGGTGLNGVRVISAGFVHIEDCIIRNFRGAAPNGFGIQLQPTAGLTFVVSRTTLFNNGTGSTGGGLQVSPTGGVASGTIDKTVFNRNVNGLIGDGFGGGAGMNVTLRDSTINGSPSNGVLLTSVNLSSFMVDHSTIANNATGIATQNAGAFVRVGSSTITGSGTATSGAGILSYGNNQINGNGADTIPSAVPGGLH
ncbi:hypothetical protein, partial [Tardiphaga sp.]|uniref:hypothetical protein n=1 Tax=Tardiphaga sp. TaxID=1926292 RepID=UPI002612ABBB